MSEASHEVEANANAEAEAEAAARFVEARRLEMKSLILLKQMRGMAANAGLLYDLANEAMGDREAELAALMEPGRAIRLEGLVLTCEEDDGFKILLVENDAEGRPS